MQRLDKTREQDMTSVLWFSAETPDVNGQGGQRRQYHQIHELVRNGHAVTVVSLAGPQDDSSISRLATVHRYRPRIKRWSNPVAWWRSPARFAKTRQFDRMVIAHSESWGFISRHVTSLPVPVYVDLHNVYSAWYASRGDPEAAVRMKKVEAEILGAVDRLGVCSQTELDRLESVHGPPSISVDVLMSGVAESEWPHQNYERSVPVVAMFGNWDWLPNRLGLEWFLQEVWPSVRDAVPDAECRLAGGGFDTAQTAEGVRYLGRVISLASYLAAATVAPVAVLGGVGAPVKFAESMASGADVIATPDGAAGVIDSPAFVSMKADQWIQWIVERLRNRESEPAPSNCRAYAFRELTWSRTTTPLTRWIEA